MANYLVTDTELTSVADAIRTKGGTSADLEFPSGFVTAIGNISGGGGNLQAKTNINPTTSSQTIEPDEGYDGLSSVQINAMASGSAATPATTITANPTISVNSSTGVITATASATQSVTPTVSAGYVSSGTAGTITVSGSNTSNLTTQAAQTIHPSTSDQTIAAGKYLTGAQTVKGVLLTNLSAGNIKKDVVVKVGDSTDDDCVTSVTGTYEGGGGINGELLIDRSISGMVSSTNVTEIGKDAFRYCDSLTGVCFPNLTRLSDEGLKESGIEIADLGVCAYLDSQSFMGYQSSAKQKLRTVILRKTDGVCPMQNTNVFNYCHDVTVYVPSDLKSSYTSASNWSTRISGGVVTLESIEGSQYENYYADGTPVGS